MVDTVRPAGVCESLHDDVASPVIDHRDSRIRSSLERGERVALAAFQEAIEGVLPPQSRDLIEQQYAEVQHTQRRLSAFLTPEVAGG